MTSHPYLLEIEGLFTQGWRPGRTVDESVGGIFEMDSSDWSNGIRYHTFDTRPDTEFKPSLRFDYPLNPPNTASRPIRDVGNRWTALTGK